LLRADKRSDGEPPSAVAAAANGGTVRKAEVRPSAAANGTTAAPAAARAFVLDDELRIAAMVGKVLEASGFAARTFTTLPPFLAELKNDAPDLVVLDLSLGEPNVVEILYQLEATSFRGKVLLISGRDETTLCEVAQIGANHGLAMLPPLKKPFRPAEVRQRYLSGQTVCAAEPNLPHLPDGGFGPGLVDRHYKKAS
jgi:CheY-like chemotaxis protein